MTTNLSCGKGKGKARQHPMSYLESDTGETTSFLPLLKWHRTNNWMTLPSNFHQSHLYQFGVDAHCGAENTTVNEPPPSPRLESRFVNYFKRNTFDTKSLAAARPAMEAPMRSSSYVSVHDLGTAIGPASRSRRETVQRTISTGVEGDEAGCSSGTILDTSRLATVFRRKTRIKPPTLRKEARRRTTPKASQVASQSHSGTRHHSGEYSQCRKRVHRRHSEPKKRILKPIICPKDNRPHICVHSMSSGGG